MWLPIRSVVCWTGGGKGINKRSRPGVEFAKSNAKRIPPESEVRNIQSSEKKTEQNRNKNRKSKRDDIRHERSRTLTGGQVETLYLLWSATHNGEAITRGKGVRGQTESKTSFNRATRGDSWYYGAAGGCVWPNQGCSKAPQLSHCYTRRNGGLSSSPASLLFRRNSAALSSSDLHVVINVRPPTITTSHHLPGSNATVFHPSPSPIPNSRRSSATQSVHSFSLPPRPPRPGSRGSLP